ncbi:MAG: thiamine-phosphate diphosphorylase [Desulfuromonadales bacterium C00003094]|nr:MAG: thiamine-phosphate diphosphorylase [Desulfuromonadales bacterium C00003094]
MARPNPIDFSLYLISDQQTLPKGRDLLIAVEQALQGGVDAVQLRDKDLPDDARLVLARQLRTLTRRYRARLLINGSVDIALAAEADGVHLGASSQPVTEARCLLGPKRLIGYSAHSPEELAIAAEQGADFATFSPVFFTPSKAGYGPPQGLERLAAICSASSIPVFALGGIDPSRIAAVRQAGAQGVAVISAILANNEPRLAAQDLKAALTEI